MAFPDSDNSSPYEKDVEMARVKNPLASVRFQADLSNETGAQAAVNDAIPVIAESKSQPSPSTTDFNLTATSTSSLEQLMSATSTSRDVTVGHRPRLVAQPSWR